MELQGSRKSQVVPEARSPKPEVRLSKLRQNGLVDRAGQRFRFSRQLERDGAGYGERQRNREPRE